MQYQQFKDELNKILTSSDFKNNTFSKFETSEIFLASCIFDNHLKQIGHYPLILEYQHSKFEKSINSLYKRLTDMVILFPDIYTFLGTTYGLYEYSDGLMQRYITNYKRDIIIFLAEEKDIEHSTFFGTAHANGLQVFRKGFYDPVRYISISEHFRRRREQVKGYNKGDIL